MIVYSTTKVGANTMEKGHAGGAGGGAVAETVTTIGGLVFKIRRNGSIYDIFGVLPNKPPEEKVLVSKEFGLKLFLQAITQKRNMDAPGYHLASCSRTRDGLVITDFFHSGENGNWTNNREASFATSDYYAEASAVAKVHNRTLAGIVMQLIQSMAAEGEVISVGNDVWSLGADGIQHSSPLNSAILAITANELLTGTPRTHPAAARYLQRRYDRLYSATSAITYRTFLENTKQHGWYGAWIGKGTVKENMLQTNANMACVDRCTHSGRKALKNG